MPNPTPLVEHARNVRDAWEQSRTVAQQRLVDSQQQLESARRNLTDHTRQLAEAEKSIAAKNAALPAAETPADQEALVNEIAALRAAARALQAAILDAAEGAGRAQAEADIATAGLRRAAAGLKSALAALQAAESDGQRLVRWKEELAMPPLQSLKGDAATALGEDPYTAANQRITDQLPAKLVAAARAGYTAERARVNAFRSAVSVPEELLTAEQRAEGGAMGLVLQRQVALANAVEALRGWVERGRERFDRALSLLRDLAATDPLLNPEQAGRIDELEEDGEAAADLRVDREEKRAAVNEAREKLDDATLTALAPDPAADVSGVQEVQDAQSELDAALGELATAQSAYDAVRDDYVVWAAAVPDGVWRKLLGFFEAEAILQELSGETPATLVSDVEDAEEELADALANAERSAVTLAFLADHLVLRREGYADARAARQRRLLSATRGDA
jgi:DNA repair exonuclease SbcCD ATPase subunit